ncbi:MAG: hypothetical protein IPJ97_13350 [Proteobacteria bacterium]|nr:hypothetical protein [Pseudomonadota bacterium]
MTRAYSPAFKRKMIERLIGSDAISALQLSKETGLRQQNLSRWLREARSLPCTGIAKASLVKTLAKIRPWNEATGHVGDAH